MKARTVVSEWIQTLGIQLSLPIHSMPLAVGCQGIKHLGFDGHSPPGPRPRLRAKRCFALLDGALAREVAPFVLQCIAAI